MNLKHKNRNLKHRKRKKNQVAKWSVVEINQDLQNNGTSVGEGNLALYLVLWLAKYLLEIAILKCLPLWNECLSNQSLSQALALWKIKIKSVFILHKSSKCLAWISLRVISASTLYAHQFIFFSIQKCKSLKSCHSFVWKLFIALHHT